MEPKEGVNTTFASDSTAWRHWLETKGTSLRSVWLIIYKKESGISSIYYDQAVDDALCYGWVDSAIRKRDDCSYYQYFAKRNPKSNWSKVNKEKVERLISEGRMRPEGMEMIELAKATGTWNALDAVEALIIPDEMQELLISMPGAKANFDRFPRNVKRGILEWIYAAKRSDTRYARIKQTVENAEKNIRTLFEKPSAS